MKNKIALEQANVLIVAYGEYNAKHWRTSGNKHWEEEYGALDSKMFYGFRDLLFNLITGEESFNNFYDRFGTPGIDNGATLPLAWGPRFWPDMIEDLFGSDKPLDQKVKEIKQLYTKCIEAEKAFKKKVKV